MEGIVYDNNLANYKLSFSGIDAGSGPRTCPPGSGYENINEELNTEGYKAGVYMVRLEGTDKAGNIGIREVEVILTEEPVVEIISPKPGGQVCGTVNITGTIKRPDVTEFSGVLWDLKSREVKDTTGAVTILASDTTTVNQGLLCSWNTQNIGEGIYELILSAKYADTTVQKIINVTVDNTPPVVEITSPGDTWQSNRVFGVIDILGTVNDANLANYEVGAGPSACPLTELPTFSPKAIANGKIGEWDTRNTPAGSYSLRLEAKDKAGNTAVVEKSILLEPDFSVIDGDISITNSDGLAVPLDKISAGMNSYLNAKIENNGIKECEYVSGEFSLKF